MTGKSQGNLIQGQVREFGKIGKLEVPIKSGKCQGIPSLGSKLFDCGRYFREFLVWAQNCMAVASILSVLSD